MRLQMMLIAASVLGLAAVTRADPPTTQPMMLIAGYDGGNMVGPGGSATRQTMQVFVIGPGKPSPEAIQVLERQRGKLLQRITELHKQLQVETQRLEVSPEILHQAAADLDNQLQTLELEEVAANARRDAIEQEIAAARENIKQNVSNDVSLEQLQSDVDRHSVELDDLARKYELAKQTAAGDNQTVISLAHQIDAATERLAEERADLTSRKMQAIGFISSQEISALSKELIEQAIDGRERDAKIQFIRGRLDALSNAFAILADLTAAEDENDFIQKNQPDIHIFPVFDDSK